MLLLVKRKTRKQKKQKRDKTQGESKEVKNMAVNRKWTMLDFELISAKLKGKEDNQYKVYAMTENGVILKIRDAYREIEVSLLKTSDRYYRLLAIGYNRISKKEIIATLEGYHTLGKLVWRLKEISEMH